MFAVIYAGIAAVVVGIIAAFIPIVGPIAAILPALVAGIGTYFFLVRRVNQLLQKEMGALQGLLANRNIDGALALIGALKKRFAKWVFLLGAQLDGQTGSILYMKKEFEKARPYLENAFV